MKLAAEGVHYFTWDPIRKRQPNRAWRRWGTDGLVRTTLRVLREFGRAHPGAPRIGVGDLSRPNGGDFGPRYGYPGHASHQNGLDVDVYYPLRSGAERAPLSVGEVDWGLSQDVVDRFVSIGAIKVFVDRAPASPDRGRSSRRSRFTTTTSTCGCQGNWPRPSRGYPDPMRHARAQPGVESRLAACPSTTPAKFPKAVAPTTCTRSGEPNDRPMAQLIRAAELCR